MKQLRRLVIGLFFAPAFSYGQTHFDQMMVQERGAGSAVQIEIQRIAEILPSFIEKHKIDLPEGLTLETYKRTVRRILGQEKPYIYIKPVHQAALNGEPLTAVNDAHGGILEVTTWEWYQLRDPKLKIAKVHHEIAGLSGKFDRFFYESSRPLLNFLEHNVQTLAEFYANSETVAKLNLQKLTEHPVSGWDIIENDVNFSYQNPYMAMDRCQSAAKAYQTKYKYVTCDLLARSDKEIFRWTEVHNEQEFVGKTTSTVDRSMNFGLDLLFVLKSFADLNDKQVTEQAIIVNKPVKMEMFKEYMTVSYGYRILARQELVLNPDQMNRELLDSASDPLGLFTSEKSAREFCRDNVISLRNLNVEQEYEAAGRVYRLESGKYACRIQGRRKYLVAE